ncbi:MAG TPA: amino acid adenylation domain-containing protein, partial [Pyrinomonadaceae bacterium]|nr:amino acid adenylation domain-containing protein [Pyrinomonadaceae bacterium]
MHTSLEITTVGVELSVPEMFEAQARLTPDAVAVSFEGERVTYRELNESSNRLANFLRTAGVASNTLCGICVERSIEMIVGVLGILKAGGAYVPLDAAYPSERLAHMFEEARMQVLLTQKGLVGKLETSKSDGTNLVLLDADWQTISQDSAENPGVKSAAQEAAYVIFTSGSTGRPKGVVMNHGALCNLLDWQLASSRAAGDGRKTVQFASLSFDVSFQEIFSTLCGGGQLVLIKDEIRRDVRRLWDLLVAEQIERLFLPPVVLQRLAEVADRQTRLPASLREIIVAGEQLKITPQIRRMFSQMPGCTLQNQYGPTESHVVAAHSLAGESISWPELPPIGRAIANTQLHILDEHLQPVEAVAAGELYIGGVCLATGYLHREDLTAERFILSPFRGQGSGRQSFERLYRTGDLARRLP